MRFILVVVALLTGGFACSSARRVNYDADTGVDADADALVDGDVDLDGDVPNDADHDVDVVVDADVPPELCDEPYQSIETWIVEELGGGVQPTITAICAASDDPVTSHRAGRVTLNLYSASLDRAMGLIAIPEELLSRIVEEPTLEVIGAEPRTVGDFEIGELSATERGYIFEATWATPPEPWVGWHYPNMRLRVNLRIQCGEPDETPRSVIAETLLNFCDDFEHPIWVSSGDECSYCMEICEMAPSPIVPRAVCDGTALPRAIDLEILPLFQSGNQLALVAEHSGSVGPVRYEWSADKGHLSSTDQGGVLWTLDPAEQGQGAVVRVALRDSDSAGFASFVWPRAS